MFAKNKIFRNIGLSSILAFSVCVAACSDDTPEVSTPPATENPDSGSSDNGENDGSGEENTPTVNIPSSDELEDNTVAIFYSEDEATLVAATNISKYITATVSDAQVYLVQSSEVTDAIGEITYILSGDCSNGSFTFEGSYKSTVVLNGLTLANKSGAAIDIQNGKRIKINVADDTVNSLADSSDGEQKATLYCKGHLEFSGTGSLNVAGYTGHAISAKEYIEIKNSRITVSNAIKDGINCNQYFLMNSGSVSISGTGDDGIQVSYKDDTDRESEDTGQIIINGGTLDITATGEATKALKADSDIIITGGNITAKATGNGIWDSESYKTKASACLGADNNVEISGGILDLSASGSGGKGINCDNEFNISGGNLNILTTGGMLVYSNGSLNHNYTGSTDRLNSDYKSSPKGVKDDGNITISGGDIYVKTSGNGGEGIESKAELTIGSGNVTVRTNGDAINSSGNMYIKGGSVDVASTNNDGLDANGNMYLSGGLVMAFGAGSPECGIDVNDEGGYKLYITGGNILGAGGNNSTPSSNGTTQGYVNVNVTISAGNDVVITNGNSTLYTFEIPNDISIVGGNGGNGGSKDGNRPGSNGNSGNVLISVEGMTSGTNYTVTSGDNSSSTTAR